MKKTLLVTLACVLLFSLSLTGCVVVKKDIGSLETRQYEITGFTGVDIGSAFEFDIARADEYSVSVTADSDLFKYIKVDKVGNTLRIEFDEFPPLGWIGTAPRFQARVTMPRLTELEISGASDGEVSGFKGADDLDVDASGASALNMFDMSAEDVNFELSGASQVDSIITVTGNAAFDLSGSSRFDGDMTADGDTEAEISGASRLELQGSAGDLQIEASGSSLLDLEDFAVQDADVDLSGASRATIMLDGHLDVNLSGASHLRYIGEPTLGEFDISGGSELEKED